LIGFRQFANFYYIVKQTLIALESTAAKNI